MATTAKTVDHSTLTTLAQAGAVRGACAVGQPGGWGIVVQYGNAERALAAKRGELRVFKKFDTLAFYLKNLGIDQFRIDARRFDAPKTEPSKRSATAERMREAHEAAAYKKWLAQEVQEAMDDLRPSVSHADATLSWEAKRKDLLARSKAQQKKTMA